LGKGFIVKQRNGNKTVIDKKGLETGWT